MLAASITQARVFDLSHTASKRQQRCGRLLLSAMIQNFHVTLSYTHAQKCLHCFPGKKSLLLRSVTWRRGRHSRHGALHLWKKRGKKTIVFGGNSDLVSLESQTNWERKSTPWGRSEVSAWDAQLGFGNGETFEVWGPRRDMIKWSLSAE